MPLFYRADVWRVGPGGWEHRTEWAGEQWRQRRIAGDRVGGEDGEQVWEVAMRRGRGKAGCLVRGAGMEVCRVLIDLRWC